MSLKEFKKYVDEVNNNIENLLKNNEKELNFYKLLVKAFNQVSEERNNLEQALDEIGKYAINLKENHIFWENDDFTNGRNAAYEMISNDILKIIQKAKGEVKNENYK